MIPGRLVGWVVGLVTFPGVMLHELAHELACRLVGVPVIEVKYLDLDDFGGRLGYVRHAAPTHSWQAVAIGMGPVLTNTVAGVALGVLAGLALRTESGLTLLALPLFYLAFSAAIHSFPSKTDADAAWRALWGGGTALWLKLVGAPALVLVYVALVLSSFWFDAVYAIFVVLAGVSLGSTGKIA